MKFFIGSGLGLAAEDPDPALLVSSLALMLFFTIHDFFSVLVKRYELIPIFEAPKKIDLLERSFSTEKNDLVTVSFCSI